MHKFCLDIRNEICKVKCFPMYFNKCIEPYGIRNILENNNSVRWKSKFRYDCVISSEVTVFFNRLHKL